MLILFSVFLDMHCCLFRFGSPDVFRCVVHVGTCLALFALLLKIRNVAAVLVAAAAAAAPVVVLLFLLLSAALCF